MSKKETSSKQEPDKNSFQKSENIYSSTKPVEPLPDNKGGAVLSSILLVFLYISIAIIGIIGLGVVALFMVCMV